MAVVAERVSVLETKVQHIDEKIDDLKIDVKDMHDCLDRTRDLLDGKMEEMLTEYRTHKDKFYEHANSLHEEDRKTHAMLAAKIEEIEHFKNRWMYLGLGAIAALGWAAHVDLTAIAQMFGF